MWSLSDHYKVINSFIMVFKILPPGFSDATSNESLLSLDFIDPIFIDPNGFEIDSISYLEKFLHQFNLSDHSVHSKNAEFKCRSYPKYNIKPNALKDDFFSKNSYFQHNVSVEKVFFRLCNGFFRDLSVGIIIMVVSICTAVVGHQKTQRKRP